MLPRHPHDPASGPPVPSPRRLTDSHGNRTMAALGHASQCSSSGPALCMARLSPPHLLPQVELSPGMRQFSPGSSPAIPCKPNASRVDEDQRRDQEICMALLQFVQVDHPKNVLASTRVIGPNPHSCPQPPSHPSGGDWHPCLHSHETGNPVQLLQEAHNCLRPYHKYERASPIGRIRHIRSWDET